MSPKRIAFLVVGCICLALGTVGVAVPILPTVPFYLVTVYCFARSSQRLHDWFVGTNLYKKNLESFVQKKGMTMKTKLGILIPVTLVMGLGFVMMKEVPVGRTILAIVWVCHVIYFLFGVRTIPRPEQAEV